MPLSLFILIAAAAPTAPVPGAHRYSHVFLSPMGEPVYAAGGVDALQTWFNQADANHDGVLSSEEMQADAERFFGRLDTNHDGEIDPDEIAHYEEVIAPRANAGLLDLPEPVVNADTDFNRGVSLDEFRKAAAVRFQALDVDHQGRLTVGLLESLRPAAPPKEKSQEQEGEDPEAMPPE